MNTVGQLTGIMSPNDPHHVTGQTELTAFWVFPERKLPPLNYFAINFFNFLML